DDRIERNAVRAVDAQGQRGGIDRLDRTHGVAHDAGYMHQSADRVAAHAQVVFDAYLGGILDLRVAAAQRRGQAGRFHRAGDADFTLTADFGAGERGIAFAQAADRRGSEQERDDAVFVGVFVEFAVIAYDRGNDAGSAVGRCGHHPAAGGILLVDGDRIEAHPVERFGRIALLLRALGEQGLVQALGPAPDVQAAGEDALHGARPVLTVRA